MKLLVALSVFLVFFQSKAQSCRASCMQGSKKQETLRRYAAVQRAAYCESSSSLGECSEFLGLGSAAAVLGTKFGLQAHKNIRNPAFQICAIKSGFIERDSFWLKVFLPPVFANKCIQGEILRKHYLAESLKQGLRDIDGLIESQEQAILEMKKKIGQTADRPSLKTYTKARDEALERLNSVEQAHPEWRRIDSLQKESDNLFKKMQIEAGLNGRASNEYQRLLKRRGELIKESQVSYSRIKLSKSYLDAEGSFQKASKNFYDAVDGKFGNPAAPNLRPMEAHLKSMEKNLKEIRSQKEKMAKMAEKLKLPLAKLELDQMSQTLNSMPATSDKYVEKLRHNAFIEEAEDKVPLHSRFRKFIAEMPGLKKIPVIGPLVTTGGAAIAVSTSANASDAVAASAADLGWVGNTACGDISPYFDFAENEDGVCKAQFTYSNKSATFFTMGDSQKAAIEMCNDEGLCKLVEASYSRFYGSIKRAQCGKVTHLTTSDGQISFESKTFPPSIKIPPSLAKYKAAVNEIAACCGQSEVRPTDSECVQYGLQKTRANKSDNIQGNSVQ